MDAEHAPTATLADGLAELWRRVEAATGGDPDAVLGDDAMKLADRLVQLSTAADAGTPVEIVYAVAVVHVVRFSAGHEEADRLMAIRLLTELAPVAPELSPGDLLATLGVTVLDGRALLAADALDRAVVSTDRGVLDDAVERLEASVLETPPDDRDLAARLSNLSLGLRLRAERFGPQSELDRAVSAAEASVAAVAPGDPELPACLANLADALLARYERRGSMVDLDKATSVLLGARAAIGEAGADPAADANAVAAACDGKLAAAHRLLFAANGLGSDLDAAVDYGRLACDRAGLAPAARASAHSNLGSALATRFALTGSARDLAQAVAELRDAAELTEPADPAAVMRWSNLSAVFQDRYQAYGAAADLDAAALAARAAVASADQAGFCTEETASSLTNLGNVLRVRGELRTSLDERGDAQADLDAAVAVARRALAATPPRHPDRAGRLNNAALAVQSRAHLEERTPGSDAAPAPGPVDEAVALMRQAVAAATDATDRSGYLANLSQLLRDGYDRAADPADLAESVDVAAQAAARPGGLAREAGVMLNLGMAHAVRWGESPTEPDFEDALAAFRRGARATGADAADRLGCARQWSQLAAAAGQWPLALAGGQAAVSLLPLAAWRGLGRADREFALFRQSPVASEAAAAALHVDDPGTAVGLLEQGRAVLWAQLTDGGDEADLLRRRAPGLASRLDEVRAALDRDEFGVSSSPLAFEPRPL